MVKFFMLQYNICIFDLYTISSAKLLLFFFWGGGGDSSFHDVFFKSHVNITGCLPYAFIVGL